MMFLDVNLRFSRLRLVSLHLFRNGSIVLGIRTVSVELEIMRHARRDINSQTEKPKTLMKKTIKDGRDQSEALLKQRNTLRQDTGKTFDYIDQLFA
jgi:hypothetical protein